MEKYEKLSREELEVETDHQELLVANLTQINGQLNTTLISKDILLQKKDEQIKKLNAQMLDYVEKANQPTQDKSKK